MNQTGFLDANPVITAAFTGSGLDSTGADWTISGVSFGAAHASRVLYAAVTLTATSTFNDISSVTIGGVTATEVVYQKIANADGWGLYAGIYKAVVPTGTSGTVFINFSGGSGVTNGACASVYRVVPTGTLTETTDETSETTVLTLDLTLAETMPWNFTIVACVTDYNGGSVPTISFDSVNRDTSRTENTTRHAHGSNIGVAKITATVSSTTSATNFVGVTINDS